MSSADRRWLKTISFFVPSAFVSSPRTGSPAELPRRLWKTSESFSPIES